MAEVSSETSIIRIYNDTNNLESFIMKRDAESEQHHCQMSVSIDWDPRGDPEMCVAKFSCSLFSVMITILHN